MGSMKHPVQEGGRLLPISKLKQRANRERCVAKPAEAIIPIQAATNALGEGSGGCGNDGARRSKGEELQRQGAADHFIAKLAVIPGRARPALPPFNASVNAPWNLLQRR